MTGPVRDFLAITTYFNLTDSVRRLENYRCFRRRLSAPLLTVEWHPDQRFQLKDGDADMLLQVRGGDLMWQKERLLTLAFAALPAGVKYVAWIDCDVLFDDAGWMDKARALLASNPVVQLYSEVAFPNQDEARRLVDSEESTLEQGSFDAMPRRVSFLSLYGRVKSEISRFDLDRRFQPDGLSSNNIMKRPAHGAAWAAQSAFVRKIGVYDRCIIGTGDMLFCYGISGLGQRLIDSQKAAGWAFYGDCGSYRAWASQAAEACAGRWGCVDGRILVLFHGNLQDRQYRSRIDGLVPFAIDLDHDLVASAGEPWSWRRDRDRLNEYFLNYLRGRKEG
jgi:hypothetical protein